MRRWCSLLFLLSLVLVVVPVHAQETSTLIETLSLVPPATDVPFGDEPAVNQWAGTLFYSDWEAMLNTRGVSIRPVDFDDLDTFQEADADRYAAATLFTLINPGIGNGLVLLDRETVGFDLSSFGQLVSYGDPPNDSLLIRGSIDVEGFIEARTANGFAVDRQTSGSGWGGAGSAVLCSTEGCDQGRMLDMDFRRPEDPFYGSLGQRSPLFVRPDLVFGTREEALFNETLSVIEGDSPSLMDDPNFLTAAEAISADLTVTQAAFAFPRVIGSVSEAISISNMNDSDLAAQLEAAQAAFTPIPAYSVVAFGSGVRDGQEITQIVLVYANASDAETAGAVIAGRIETGASITGRPWTELLGDRNMVLSVPAVFTSETTGQSAAVIEFVAPPPPDPQEAQIGVRDAASGTGYNLMMRALMQRDLLFLATSF